MENEDFRVLAKSYYARSSQGCNVAADAVITEVDLYITQAGNIAFLERVIMTHNGPVFEGYVLHNSQSSGVLVLKWHECGACITDGEAHHRIVKRV